MAQNRLRVYYGPEEAAAGQRRSRCGTRSSCRWAKCCRCCSTPFSSGRAWVDDFADDEITISSDLYEVLLAYQHFRRPSA